MAYIRRLTTPENSFLYYGKAPSAASNNPISATFTQIADKANEWYLRYKEGLADPSKEQIDKNTLFPHCNVCLKSANKYFSREHLADLRRRKKTLKERNFILLPCPLKINDPEGSAHHIFCAACIQEWFRRTHQCAGCRRVLTSIDVPQGAISNPWYAIDNSPLNRGGLPFVRRPPPLVRNNNETGRIILYQTTRVIKKIFNIIVKIFLFIAYVATILIFSRILYLLISSLVKHVIAHIDIYGQIFLILLEALADLSVGVERF